MSFSQQVHGVLRALAAGMLALLALAATPAAALQPTLDRIRETGVIRIGYGETVPFSYLDENGAVVGYSIDICRRVVADLQQKLGLAKLDIQYVFRTPMNRVQLLRDGAMDIECNASTVTAERQRAVAFALPHYFAATRYVALARNGLRRIADLSGRSVSVPLGTVNVGQINEINRQYKLNLAFVRASSLQEAFAMVSSGQVAAFAMDDVLLAALIATSSNPQDYSMSEEMVTTDQPYGFMMRLGDEDFVKAVNESLSALYRSPEMAMIYTRWFETSLPRNNVNLAMPMRPQLKRWFANPVMEKLMTAN